MSNLKNKIEASDKNINDLLKDQKFYIDYFQREYRWEERHMVALIEDLTTTFLNHYQEDHERQEVANYPSYYLGPVVFSESEGRNSIIDGQQRITSITLLLIYLQNLQKNSEVKVPISNLVFSEKYGDKSFNMTDEDRKVILKSLYETGEYIIKEDEDATVINISARYEDIHKNFPEELQEEALPFFIDWLIDKVILVKIKAYSDENAYTIFETMNDRGMNLTSSEMLKGYVLSRIQDPEKRSKLNELWKEQMLNFQEWDKDADQEFFKAWFRGKYAQSIRPGKAGSENQDYELIATRFHNWFKDNHMELFGLKSSDDFYSFFTTEFVYMAKSYLLLYENANSLNDMCPHVFYSYQWRIADSLSDQLYLAALNPEDSADERYKKLDVIGRFLEAYTVKRSINYKKFSASSIRYTFFNYIRQIRNQSLPELSSSLKGFLDEMDQDLNAVQFFRLHGQNKRFVKHLLCRITSYVDQETGRATNYLTYARPKGKKYEIEHLWADHFDRYEHEFEYIEEFREKRNSIGGLILVQNGTNQSYGDDPYEQKLLHYLKENNYAQTLHPEFYVKNPNYRNSSISDLNFVPHESLNRNDIDQRAILVKELCERIWDNSNFIQN
ncbi:DUF262 domain-containing protein [Nonlabens ulvanivorans]|uniref:Uncharacterized protein with ParB-like and HNH nuclease domain n=1 Tax=Nonlabens ulvanivorans TaxID=906888 RepID=A0A084JX64_NONUL|nr:DUF262 domain-containing protein [Nonlabens ulvanivorans]KEZ93548.1 hypothetical protein IL45_04885 [Nonlabens ulvanivorans]PRX14125.1 uncharacterized protein with ParB-like and HNH nuclease domain [Nonlabens ulvanivorans]